MNTARLFLIDKELDALFRKSFKEWSDVVFKLVSLQKKENCGDAIEEIVEMYQTRNLIVHADGIVNDQYLNNVENSKYKKGQRVNLDKEYILKKIKSVKYLSWHVMNSFWIKNEDEIGEAFDNFNDAVIANINDEEDSIPEFLDFYSKSNKLADSSRCIAKINYFLYYKLNGGLADYEKKLDNFSVNHLSEDFRIAKSILKSEPDVLLKFKNHITSLSDEEFLIQIDWPIYKAIEDQEEVKNILSKKLEEVFKKK